MLSSKKGEPLEQTLHYGKAASRFQTGIGHTSKTLPSEMETLPQGQAGAEISFLHPV
jgi:hypothetical protein